MLRRKPGRCRRMHIRCAIRVNPLAARHSLSARQKRCLTGVSHACAARARKCPNAGTQERRNAGTQESKQIHSTVSRFRYHACRRKKRTPKDATGSLYGLFIVCRGPPGAQSSAQLAMHLPRIGKLTDQVARSIAQQLHSQSVQTSRTSLPRRRSRVRRRAPCVSPAMPGCSRVRAA